MKFTATTLLACAAIANAAPIADSAGNTNAVIPACTESHFSGVFNGDVLVAKEDNETEQSTQKRDLVERAGATVAVIGIAAVSGAAIITKIAVELGQQTLANLGKWNDVREKFTQATTLEMWNRNPDYNTYPAAICYNKGYSLKNNAGKTGLLSAKLELGLLSTE
ncbi:hypothetical protein NHQ30_007676 [Ciborinia camelliae]|nr:hypothetical protein NHQ30_007676 [Ciborinia camelliae]